MCFFLFAAAGRLVAVCSGDEVPLKVWHRAARRRGRCGVPARINVCLVAHGAAELEEGRRGGRVGF